MATAKKRAEQPMLDGMEPTPRELGFRGPQVCSIVGITYRQLDYWARTDLVRPSITDARGSGTQRTYSFQDLVRAQGREEPPRRGVKLQTARQAIDYLREDLGDDWATANLVLDGTNSVLARTDDMLIDLVRHGQGVLNIVPLGHVMEELDAGVREHVAEMPRRRGRLTSLRSRSHTSRSASRTTPNASSRSCSTSTRSPGSTSRARSCSSATATGNPAQAFSPDFYLPTYDLYIEITTLNQKLVTKKNRKARRLVELYPDVQIKVLYQRDYLQLLVKYGLEPPSQLVGDAR